MNSLKFEWFWMDSSIYYGIKNQTNFGIHGGTALVAFYGIRAAYMVPGLIPKEGFVESLNLAIKVSIDGRYCAVLTEGNYWVDFYGLAPRPYHPQLNQAIEQGEMPKDIGKYLFTLKRSGIGTYGTQIVLEFGQRLLSGGSSEKEQCFLFNDSVGTLDIYNMQGAKVISRKYGDVIILEYRVANNRDLIMDVENMNSKTKGVIYFDLERLFNDSAYKGEDIEMKGNTTFEKWINKEECIYKLQNGQIYKRNSREI